MKRTDAQIREFCRKISDEQLRFINMRFQQNLPGDRAVVLDVLSKDKAVDRYLSAASSAEEFFNCYEHVGKLVKEEVDRRHKLPGRNKKPFKKKKETNADVDIVIVPEKQPAS